MEANNFFGITDEDFFNKYVYSVQIKEWNEIISNWNHSSVKLKEWLNKYFPSEFGKYSQFVDINVDGLLPYRSNGFWKTDDLWRLEYSLKAKLVILGMEGLDTIKTNYLVEALRLWLRFDSRHTKLSWDQFKLLVDKCYNETETDWNGTVDLVREKCKEYGKRKRKQKVYHYKETDFCLINEDMTLKEAYDFWYMYEFDHIKQRFIQEETKKFIARNSSLSTDLKNKLYETFKKELDEVEFKRLSIGAFKKTLNKLKIKYKKR